MKKLLILAFIAFECQAFAQRSFTPDSIPMNNGKIVFSIEFKTDLTKDMLRTRVLAFVQNEMKPFKGALSVDNENITACQVTDYLSISSNAIYTFAMYMSYQLSFEYTDNVCFMTIRNLRFTEKEEYETREKFGNDAIKTPSIYTAEDIMIDGKYKHFSASKASARITVATIKHINTLVEELCKMLK